MTNLTLRDAIASGRLDDFVRQEEARGVVADRAAFEKLIKTAAKPPRSADQTSRSPSGDGSTGTQIPPDSAACAQLRCECACWPPTAQTATRNSRRCLCDARHHACNKQKK
eukprot:TRINITY_DN72790_c0_g1_i3.p1 TRINITY_DN72790_c0_g1~~TRINITY_DN72790_c0_g1_i3.p1  ORF type:complete len:111 (-),score=10.09 TRINITY_DN72790_c0_g1_i3:53-385(-)